MKSSQRPNLPLQLFVCLALTGVIMGEIAGIFMLKRSEREYVMAGARTIEAIRALGPLAATKEELAACEASFGETFHVGGAQEVNSLSGRTRMTVELARVLAGSGLEEREASVVAARLVRSPEATLTITCIAKSEGIRVRKITEGREDTERFWTVDITCADDKLPELFTTLGENTSGMALSALDMHSSKDKDAELRLELTEPSIREEAP